MIAQTDRTAALTVPATVDVPAPRRAPVVPTTSAPDGHVELIAAGIVAEATLVNRVMGLALLLAVGLVAVLVLL